MSCVWKKNPTIMSAFSTPVTRVLLINFISEGKQTFSAMELLSFKKIIETLQPRRTVVTRKMLRLKIQDAFENMKSALVKKLNDVDYVSTSADCWSARQRSYLGVTCHQTDKNVFREMFGSLGLQTHYIAAALEEIHSGYEIRLPRWLQVVAHTFWRTFE